MPTSSPAFGFTIPLADGSDGADLAALLRNLGLDVEAKAPGVSILTTAQMNALTGAQLFAGRIVACSTDGRVYRWTGTAWQTLAQLATDGTLPMAGKKITGLGAGTASTDAATRGQLDDAMPVGAVITYAGTTAPNTSWGLCDGSEVSRTGATATLYARLGTVHGDGNGSTTFNLPDLRSRFILGAGQGEGDDSQGRALTNRAVAAKGGSAAHTLTSAEMPAHSHGGQTGEDSPDHTHLQMITAEADGSPTRPVDFNTNAMVPAAIYDHGIPTGGARTRHRHTIPSDGAGGHHNNLPPFYALTYLIKIT